MLSIQTNVNSLIAQQNLGVNNKFQAQTIQQLTSGYRINSSGDDAAGLAVANKFRNDVSELTQGVANGNDAVAQLQIMDGGMSNISSILDRLKTLATQSGSASFTGDRSVLNNEFQTDISEIDRQAQAIGLNTGGSNAKSVAVYFGGGKGTSSANVLANGTVTVDLSRATVDAQSLGLKGVQAANTNATVTNDTDIGAASTTSVQAILAANGAGKSVAFNFQGPGFGDTTGQIPITVNLNGVADSASLVTNINAAIQTAAQGTSGAAAAFKAANIVASINTDSLGRQQLAFSSSNAAFQVSSVDTMGSALLGSFAVAGAPTGTATFAMISGGAHELATAGTSGNPNTAADLTWGSGMATTDHQVVSVSANDATGNAHALSLDLGAAGTTMTMAQAITAINAKLQGSNDSTLKQVTAVATGASTFNFMSALNNFTISVGSDTVAADGIQTNVGKSVQALTVGTGSSADISTLQGATNAVTAVSAAVQSLGTAQAAIGKGQNQLGYALSLATSQITNFSAAASQIRDTDVAQQAANLTKAQVLQQASIAAMAQANSAPQAVLSLLKG